MLPFNRESDDQNQYGRREIIQLHNMSRKKGENIKRQVINFFYEKMGLTIRYSDISTCHGMNTPRGSEWNGGSPLYDPLCPPIYIKFVSRDVKKLVYKHRFRLRGQMNSAGYKYLIHENLTPFRRELFKDVKETLEHFRYVWTNEGTIMVRKDQNSKPKKNFTYDDLNALVNEFRQP